MPKMSVDLSQDNEPLKSKSATYSARKRRLVIELFGNKCELCGCTDYDKLQLDHKEQIAISRAERDRQREMGVGLYNDLLNGKKDKANYQLLCDDCHKKKTMDNYEYLNPVKRLVLGLGDDDE